MRQNRDGSFCSQAITLNDTSLVYGLAMYIYEWGQVPYINHNSSFALFHDHSLTVAHRPNPNQLSDGPAVRSVASMSSRNSRRDVLVSSVSVLLSTSN